MAESVLDPMEDAYDPRRLHELHRARIAELEAGLETFVAAAEAAFDEWDKAPDGMKPGKLLRALADRDLNYRADIVKAHAARIQDGQGQYMKAQGARISKLEEALGALLHRYRALVNSGDCGFSDCDDEPEVIAADALLNIHSAKTLIEDSNG